MAKEVEEGRKAIAHAGLTADQIRQYTIAHAADADADGGGGGSSFAGPPREVSVCIAETFPSNSALFGSLVIAVMSSPAEVPATPRARELFSDKHGGGEAGVAQTEIVPCAGRSYLDVSREINRHVQQAHAASLISVVCVIFTPPRAKRTSTVPTAGKGAVTHRAYGSHVSSACGMAKQMFMVKPTEDRGPRAVRNIMIAWAIEVQHVTKERLRHIPVIWRLTAPALCGGGGPVVAGQPHYRARRPGPEDACACAADCEESSEVGAGGRPDPLDHAPVPHDGHITTPLRSFGPRGRASSVRAVRQVDIHVFHHMVQDWVTNCQMDVAVISAEGKNVTSRLARIPPRPHQGSGMQLTDAVEVSIEAIDGASTDGGDDVELANPHMVSMQEFLSRHCPPPRSDPPDAYTLDDIQQFGHVMALFQAFLQFRGQEMQAARARKQAEPMEPMKPTEPVALADSADSAEPMEPMEPTGPSTDPEHVRALLEGSSSEGVSETSESV